MAEQFALDEIIPGPVVDTDDQRKADQLHARCCTAAFQIKRNIKNLCIDLSLIKDNRYYLLLGSTSFTDYCETSLHIAKVQASKYYTVGVFLRSFENVQPTEQKVTDCNSFTDLGIEKMYLLASLTSPEFQALQKDCDLSSLSRRELNSKIKDIRALQQVKESQGFSGSVGELKKRVEEFTEDYNSSFSPSSLSDLPPVLLLYYRTLLEVRSLLSRISEIQSSIENDNSVKFPAGMYFHPEFDLDRINIELHDIEINYNI